MRPALLGKLCHECAPMLGSLADKEGAFHFNLASAACPFSVICIQTTISSRPPTFVTIDRRLASPSITSIANLPIENPSATRTVSALRVASRASACNARRCSIPPKSLNLFGASAV
jgi:hypothetical protein